MTGQIIKHIRKTTLLLTAAFISVCISLTGCSKRLIKYDAQFMGYFDTVAAISFYAENENQFNTYKQLFVDDLAHYHRLFDIYHSYDGMNNVRTINENAGKAPVKVEKPLYDMLKLGVSQYDVTDGNVNIAFGSVLSIWHDARTKGTDDPANAALPDMEALRKANAHTSISDIIFNDETMEVFLKDPEMSLDVGSVAKGYAAHLAAEHLKEAGLPSGMINVGGNVETIGKRGDGKNWRTGIVNPDTSSSKTALHVVKLNDMALITSGDYQRFYEVNGIRYHHIINKDTLMPRTDYHSVTILSEDGGLADAYSTAVFNMSLEEGMQFIENQKDTEALWVLNDYSEVMSSGFKNYLDD